MDTACGQTEFSRQCKKGSTLFMDITEITKFGFQDQPWKKKKKECQGNYANKDNWEGHERREKISNKIYNAHKGIWHVCAPEPFRLVNLNNSNYYLFILQLALWRIVRVLHHFWTNTFKLIRHNSPVNVWANTILTESSPDNSQCEIAVSFLWICINVFVTCHWEKQKTEKKKKNFRLTPWACCEIFVRSSDDSPCKVAVI